MRHHNANRKFGRVRKVRKALMRSLALALIVRGKIKTTEAKAKELRPYIEKFVTRAKKDSLASRRLVGAEFFNSTKEVKKLFEVIAPKYVERPGGYTRITKLSTPRKGDASKLAVIEFI
ncbi:MAG: large subunit ribosomal protein L17 [Parcubacteria group bacterium LiPW_30]|jgi:large subunit ribosomal protein L17|nr:MAG: large subunit ribosomal protein L17 [Parcubacteria group bacterium LiPW_30]